MRFACGTSDECTSGYSCLAGVCTRDGQGGGAAGGSTAGGSTGGGSTGGGATAGGSTAGGSTVGMLSVVVDDTPLQVDLTAEGTTDWAKWGRLNTTNYDRKAAAPERISTFAAEGDAGEVQRFTGLSITYQWSDGAPAASASTTTGLAFTEGLGYSLTAPADGRVRVLRLYAAPYFARMQLEASLEDSSAPQVVDTSRMSMTGPLNSRFTVTYRAGSDGGTLLLRLRRIDLGFANGDINIQAATLVRP